MEDNRNTAYTILIIISVIGALIILLTGCSVHKTSSSNKITEYVRDTVYQDKNIYIDRIIRDTVHTENVVIEYIPDSVGGWLPSKKTVSNGTKIGKTDDSVLAKDTESVIKVKDTLQTTETKTKEVERTSFWWWVACFVGGAIVGVLALYAGKYLKGLIVCK